MRLVCAGNNIKWPAAIADHQCQNDAGTIATACTPAVAKVWDRVFSSMCVCMHACLCMFMPKTQTEIGTDVLVVHGSH